MLIIRLMNINPSELAIHRLVHGFKMNFVWPRWIEINYTKSLKRKSVSVESAPFKWNDKNGRNKCFCAVPTANSWLRQRFHADIFSIYGRNRGNEQNDVNFAWLHLFSKCWHCQTIFYIKLYRPLLRLQEWFCLMGTLLIPKMY